jgi:hypothetical protein
MGFRTYADIIAGPKRLSSVQPSVPKIATSSITTRRLNAPVAPTAIGRLGSVLTTEPLTLSTPKSSGFTPIPSASAAPLGGGAFATTSSPGGLGGIGGSIESAIKSYAPLAIKIVLAVIVFKIVLWLIKGRRR